MTYQLISPPCVSLLQLVDDLSRHDHNQVNSSILDLITDVAQLDNSVVWM